MAPFCSEPLWNATQSWDTQHPDLSTCLENTFLIYIPNILLVVSSAAQHFWTKSNLAKRKAIPPNTLNMTRIALSFLVAALATLDLWATIDEDTRGLDPDGALYLGPIIQTVGAGFTIYEQFVERRSGVATSGVLFMYWFLTVLCGIPKVYSYAVANHPVTSFRWAAHMIYLGFALIQFALSCIVDQLPESYRKDPTASPEMRASFLSYITFNWISRLCVVGYKKALEEKDVFTVHHQDLCKNTTPEFSAAWESEVAKKSRFKPSTHVVDEEAARRRDRKSKRETITAETSGLIAPSSSSKRYDSTKDSEVVINMQGQKYQPNLLKILLKVYAPKILFAHFFKLIYDILQFGNPTVLNSLIFYTQNKLEPEWHGYIYMVMFFLITVIDSLLFHQMFHLAMRAAMHMKSSVIATIYRKSLTMGNEAKQASTVGDIVNLMSVDSERLQQVVAYIFLLWSSPLQIIVALILLWNQMEVATLAGVAVMIVLIPVNTFLTIQQRNLQVKQMRYKDSRTRLMNEILSGMKVLKLYAWEVSYKTKIDEIREKELSVLRTAAYLNGFSIFAWTCAPFLVTLATFLTYIYGVGKPLTADRAFTSIALFNIIRGPLNMLPMILTFLAQASVSVKRIQKFLSQSDLDAKAVDRVTPAGLAIQVKRGLFSWNPDTKTGPGTLQDINIEVKTAQLVGIVGPVGCGKSSLIQAVLGDMHKLKGKVRVSGSIAYVAQQAWIQNDTIRNNILFGQEYDRKKYREVVEACALKPDFDILPAGDKTEIGEKGINLSGGQKQRVAVARAVYQESDLYLFDDPLSAVDSHVAKHMFDEVLSSTTGRLARKTRLLVTHALHYLPQCDQVIVIKDGKISEVGAFDELVERSPTFAEFVKEHIQTQVEERSALGGDDDNELAPVLDLLMRSPSKVDDHHGTDDADDEPDNSAYASPMATMPDNEKFVPPPDPALGLPKVGAVSEERKRLAKGSNDPWDPFAATRTGLLEDENETSFQAKLLRELSSPEKTPKKNAGNDDDDDDDLFHPLKPGTSKKTSSPPTGDLADIQKSLDISVGKVRERKERRSKKSSSRKKKQKPKEEPDEMKGVLRRQHTSESRMGGAADQSKLITIEKQETGRVSWKVTAAYIRSLGFSLTSVWFTMFLAYQGWSVFSNVWLSQWTADPTLTRNDPNQTEVLSQLQDNYMAVYGFTGIGQAFFILIFAMVYSLSMVEGSRTMHSRMLFSTLRSPMAFFDTTPSGRIINRFTKDVETIDNTLPSTFRSWLMTFFSVISTLVIIVYSLPIFGVVIPFLLIFYYFVQRFYIPTTRQLKRIESTTRSPIYNHFSETITGASTIRAFAAQNRFILDNLDKLDRNNRYYFPGVASNRWLGVRLEFIGNLTTIVASLFAIFTRDSLNSSDVGLAISYALSVTSTLNWMVRMSSDLETNIVSVERIMEYVANEHEAPWVLENPKPPKNWPTEGKIKMKRYAARYRPGLELVLHSIDTEINQGEKVGIVGRTGAGKSTLTLALFRLIEPAGGRIIIDGIDIAKIGLHQLRSRLTILPQDPVIFSGTLKSNLDPFHRYKDATLWSALRLAHLAAFVKSVPKGLDHECGEGGINLSIGQRQLVCLARALLRKTKILVLDEATASIDFETDVLIQQTIRREFRECTVVTIAHRLNTILDSDRIMVLDQGRIVEFASPRQLLEDSSTVFYGMAKDANISAANIPDKNE